MAYPLQFLRLVAIGSLYGVESFSYSMALVHAGGATPNVPDEVPAGIVDAFAEYHASPGMIGTQAKLETLKLNLIGTDGKYVNDDTVLHDYDPVVPGTGGSAIPPQIAYAVSLRTAKARGRGHAGRFYVPLPSMSIESNGYLSDVGLNIISGPSIALVNAINEALVPWRVGVTSNLGAGHQEYVTYLRFGRVLDTIRSRRTSIPEGYVDSAPLTP